MDVVAKIVFIDEQRLLIMEMSPVAEVNPFLNGIFFNLTLDNVSNEQPIKMTCEGKNRVVDFLGRKYSKVKEVNRLIKFFRDVPIQNYIYIYPYNEQFMEVYDTLKESLPYYNKGETDETIALEMKEYIEVKGNIQKYLDIYPYEIQMIVPEQKVIKGEKDKQKRKCIYCGGSVKDGKTRYQKIAHAIPEALGNTKFIQREECDACNDYFARNAEEDLCNFLVWKRLQYGLKGKNGYPIFQLTDGRYARFFDYEKEEYESDWGYFESIKAFVKENKVKGPVVISNQMPDSSGNIEITYVKDYVPQHVYKTFVKCVIGLIGNESLSSFVKTIDWLRYGNDNIQLPDVVLFKCKRLILEPELYIFTRKKLCDYRIPYCYGELRILDTIFVFIIPFTENDKYDFVDEKECRIFLEMLRNRYGRYETENFSSIVPRKIEEQCLISKQII